MAVVGSLYRKEEIGSSGCGGQLIQEGGNLAVVAVRLEIIMLQIFAIILFSNSLILLLLFSQFSATILILFFSSYSCCYTVNKGAF